MLLKLALLFQLSDPRSIARHEFDKIEHLRDSVQIQTSINADIQYRKKLLRQRHEDFIIKFNLYLEKYNKGLIDYKLLKDAVKSWNTLRKTEGFDIAVHNTITN